MRRAMKITVMALALAGLSATTAAACWWDRDYRRSRVYGYGPTYSYYGYDRGYYRYGPGVRVAWYGGRRHHHHRWWY